MENSNATTRCYDNDDGDDNYLYLIYLREYNKPSARTMDVLSKYCRKFHSYCSLILGAYVCNIDLCATVEMSEDEHEGQAEDQKRIFKTRTTRTGVGGGFKRWLPQRLARSTWHRQLRAGWIPTIILATYLTLLTILLADLFYLYRFGINRMRLTRVQTLISEHGLAKQVALAREDAPVDLIEAIDKLRCSVDNRSSELSLTGDNDVASCNSMIIVSLGHLEPILVARSNELSQTLAYLGDKFIAWGLIPNCFCLVSILACLVLYLSFMWLNMFVRQQDYQLHRDSIDLGAEEMRVNYNCQKQVLKYLESNRIYATIVSKYTSRSLVECAYEWPIRKQYAVNTINISNKKCNLLETNNIHLAIMTTTRLNYANDPPLAHQSTNLIMQLLTSGSLRPLNRCKIWRQHRDILFAFLYLNSIGYTMFFSICSLAMLYRHTNGWLDLGELCMYAQVLISACGFVFHCTKIVVSCVDQALLVRRLLRLMRQCVELNEQELKYLSSKTGLGWAHSSSSIAEANRSIERINSNYLFVFITYKMFVTQFKTFKRTNRGIFSLFILIPFLVPVIGRFHSPYLELDGDYRLIILILSATTLLPLNMMCLPMCYMNARCQELFIGLSNLMAHIGMVRQAYDELDGGAQIYNAHAVACLLKELSNPKQMLEQFVVESIGFRATYSDLVRLHFWWGLVVLSMLLSSQGDQYQDPFFGSFLKDPLGVWCFRLV